MHTPLDIPISTDIPSLRSFTEGGDVPSYNSQAKMEGIKRIGELEELERDLAIRYDMAGIGEIDSVEVFAEAKHRALSDNGCLGDAKQMEELVQLEAFEAFSLANTLAVEEG
ncbi:hypothetical protein EV421DRAFT_1741861 [Armillaria borealis]|uniref:Uncharacterized protein n=1 Tax=Armillaria borealis TaxID=47425 RepID=A0AA39MFJ1_9AGAR|nr:hypothetical protein EV421DRAFT_1741861 [Armillaria borealis]